MSELSKTHAAELKAISAAIEQLAVAEAAHAEIVAQTQRVDARKEAAVMRVAALLANAQRAKAAEILDGGTKVAVPSAELAEAELEAAGCQAALETLDQRKRAAAGAVVSAREKRDLAIRSYPDAIERAANARIAAAFESIRGDAVVALAAYVTNNPRGGLDRCPTSVMLAALQKNLPVAFRPAWLPEDYRSFDARAFGDFEQQAQTIIAEIAEQKAV